MPYCARCKESVKYIDGNYLCEDCWQDDVDDDLDAEEGCDDDEWDD